MRMHGCMRTLTALLISDNRPGHYHLSDGVVAALRRLRPVRVVRMVVHRRCSGRLSAWLSNLRFPPETLLRLAYGLAPSQIPPADVVVSAGAETLPASAAIARLTGVPNIFCGSLRRYDHESFRLVLTSYPTHANRPRHVMVLKPSALSRETLPTNPLTADAVPKVMALLLGGNSRECRFCAEDWSQLLDLIETSYQAVGIRWVVSNSPRTPEDVSDLFAARMAARSGAIITFTDIRRTGPGTLGRVLEPAQAVVCTDDSSSMISECISAGRPVIGVRPRRVRFTRDEEAYRKYLIENGWYRSIAISVLTPDLLIDEITRVRPPTEDPVDRLAGILQERLPELFDDAQPVPVHEISSFPAAHQLPVELRPLGSGL